MMRRSWTFLRRLTHSERSPWRSTITLSQVVVFSSIPLRSPSPSNVSEIRGNQIEVVFHLPGPRHPALINQRESGAVLPQHVGEFRNQPILAANLHGKLVFLRKLFQKRN